MKPMIYCQHLIHTRQSEKFVYADMNSHARSIANICLRLWLATSSLPDSSVIREKAKEL